MNTLQIIALAMLGMYYLAYFMKALLLKRQGIAVHLLGKGNKPKKALIIEACLRFATLAGAVIQFGSVLFDDFIRMIPLALPVRIAGVVLLFLGVFIFTAAMLTMRDNWRAGFDRDQNTSLVTNGIYRFSRNPAFVGFDLLYIGCAVTFPNIVNVAAAFACVLLFHVQILGEEKYCAEAFGQEYADYRTKVRRYLGRADRACDKANPK